jgi:putative thioredoxin
MIFETNAQPRAGGDVVKDGTTQSFNADVIQASMTVPVLVDFWAPWCGPCKQLTPALEQAVRRSGGRVRLVKINIDKEQALASQLRVQSVPTVYAFVQGRPVDAFVGAQSESQIAAFVDRLLKMMGSPLEGALEQGQALLAGGDARAAAELFQRILREEPHNAKAVAGLIRARVALGDLKAARKALEGLPPTVVNDPAVAQAVSAVDLAEQAKSAGNVADLRKRLEAVPHDHQLRFDLAQALYARQHVEAAIDELLRIVGADRTWNDEAARKQLVKIFDALGPSHPLTLQSRRRLSSILFS